MSVTCVTVTLAHHAPQHGRCCVTSSAGDGLLVPVLCYLTLGRAAVCAGDCQLPRGAGRGHHWRHDAARAGAPRQGRHV